ncbi:MAG: hypothetical protein HZB26_14085 [Candidatus Hydrogenedentes bacterium]|nr:hypothetical protein [Candidatus Hydrogenedentota bacterium]
MMNNDEREKLWSAYLDGQLSASEAARFDQSLTQQQREQLAAEMRFESSLADVLGKDAACPGELWRRTLARVDTAPRPKSLLVRRWLPAAIAMAAALAMIVAGLVVPRVASAPSFLALESAPPKDLAVADTNMEAEQRFLQSHGVNVRLMPFPGGALTGHENTRILGLREARFGKEPVYELYYECCGQPLKIALAKKGSPAAELMNKDTAPRSAIISTRDIGGYRVALVGTHHAQALLDHITEADTQPS